MGKYKYFTVSPGMDGNSIYRQYKMMATKHHPDTEYGSDHAFQELGQEYNMLNRLIRVDGSLNFNLYMAEEVAYASGIMYKDTIQSDIEPMIKMGFFFKLEKHLDKLPEWLKPVVNDFRNRSGFDQRVERFDLSEELQKLDAKKMKDKVLSGMHVFKNISKK